MLNRIFFTEFEPEEAKNVTQGILGINIYREKSFFMQIVYVFFTGLA